MKANEQISQHIRQRLRNSIQYHIGAEIHEELDNMLQEDIWRFLVLILCNPRYAAMDVIKNES